MSHLVVFGFDGIHAAGEVLNTLRALHVAHLIDLQDACAVERDAQGKVLPEVEPSKPRILKTLLSNAAEERLRNALITAA
ncbi:MAG: hypothetical protein B7Y95_03965 [Rhizobiales bacterium 32-66-11]|jgi:uncharacterized membrane protein|nr:MAG: hypothetical protein B7Y95_03965 [Rhizobiales bacterium 32-66-11]